MTRLTENDIAGIEAEWATYERRLEELTGDDLLTLAARTLGIDPETARSGVRELRVGAIPISSGEGLIGGFAPIRRSLSNILFFGKEYALRTWKGNPIHFPFHADAWKRPHPKTRAPEHIGIYCPCTQVSNSDDSLSGVLESRVRFFRLALLPLPFHCRMVGENRAKETGRFQSFRNISALSVALLRSRGICGTTGTRSESDAGTPGVRCPALPGDGPGRTCPGALMKRRHRSRKEWRGRMARLDRFSVYCPCRRMVLFPQTDGGKRTCGEGRGRTEERSAFLLGRGALRAGRG